MNLEKSQACQNILRNICSDTQEITHLTKINSAIFDIYANILIEKLEAQSESLNDLLNNISIPSLSKTQKQICWEKSKRKEYS